MAISRMLTSAVILVAALMAAIVVLPSQPASAQPDEKEVQPLDPDEIAPPRLESDAEEAGEAEQGDGEEEGEADKDGEAEEEDGEGEADKDGEAEEEDGEDDGDKDGEVEEEDGEDDGDKDGEAEEEGASTRPSTSTCNGQIDDRPFVDGTTLALSAGGHDYIAAISFQGSDPANPQTDSATSSPWTAALITTRSRMFFTEEGSLCAGTYGQWYDDEPAFRCAGTLIDPEWILTAAHCVSDHKPSGVSGYIGIIEHDLQVRLGSSEWNENGDLFDVSEIHLHPDWSRQVFDDGTWLNDGATWTGDLALLRLASPATQEPALLGSVASTDLGTAQATRGWGINEQGERPSSRLWWSNDLVDDHRCETNDSTDTYVADESLCIDVLNGFGACFGDSGSAIGTTNGIANNTATTGFTLTGVASYMIFSHRTGSNETRCDDPRYVAYTHIDGPRLDWVLDTTD